MPLLDYPDFREWFRATHHVDLDERPELRLGECHGCGSSGVPLLINHCLVCLACDFGMSMGEQRIADALRAFIHVLVNEPPEAAHRLVSNAMYSLADAARNIAEDERSGDDPEDAAQTA
jgi:hypothetical protein